MRFACQSCGKAYNLPEERIAEKSNVKLKCRVCGAIVEVKRQGEIVAHLLSELDAKAPARVSEAPAPLTSMSPEDPEDATAAIAVGDPVLSEDRALPPLPPPPATGFAMASLPPPPPREPARSEPPVAPPLPPPAAMSVTASGRPGGGEGPVLNGSNGASAHGVSAPPLPGESDAAEDGADGAGPAMDVPYTAASNPAPMNAPVPSALAGLSPSMAPPVTADAGSARTENDDTNKKMVAAFLTGIVVDRIIAGLFF